MTKKSVIDPQALLEGLRLCLPEVQFERGGLCWKLLTEASLTATSGALWVCVTTLLHDALGEEVDRCVALYPLDDESQRQLPFQLAHAISEKHCERVDRWREERWARVARPDGQRQVGASVCQTDLMKLLDPAAPLDGVGPAALRLEAALDEGLAFWKLPPSVGGTWAAYRNDDAAMRRALVEAARVGAKRVVLALARAQAHEIDRVDEGRWQTHLPKLFGLVAGASFTEAMRRLRDVVGGATGPDGASEKTIYVAGSSRDRTYVRNLVEALQSRGWTVTFDWTNFHGFDVPEPSAEVLAEVLAEGARLDAEGVRRARVFWYVAPERLSEGSATELGMALALGKEVVVSGPVTQHRVFPRLAARTFAKHDEALAYLCGSV
jgi:hypothetical protein